MPQVLRQLPDAARSGRSGADLPSALVPANPQEHARSWGVSWGTSWSRAAAPQIAASSLPWRTATDESYALLQRLALAHIIVGGCVALALVWQVWSASALAMAPVVGLVVAAGGVLARLFSRLDRPMTHLWARATLVAVDLCAAGGILWLRGGEGWALLVLLPPIALAIAFFAERGGALATLLAVLVIVAVYGLWNTPASGWMPSLLAFLGVAVLIVAFLSIYSAQVRETSENLRWLLSDARATAERLQVERQQILARLRTLEQTQEPLLQERVRFTDAAAELAMLAQRAAQGDPSAGWTLQTMRPGVYGPMAELASALSRLSRASAASGNAPAISALSASVRAQGQALEALDRVTRALCVGANELVLEVQALEPGVSLINSEASLRAFRHVEQQVRTQATEMALLGTQLADIRSMQENLEMSLTQVRAGAKTPTIFATSDVRVLSSHSGFHAAFGASANGRAIQQSDHGTVR